MSSVEEIASNQQDDSQEDTLEPLDETHHLAVSKGLPLDGQHAENNQPVRPWTPGSRPSSALETNRPHSASDDSKAVSAVASGRPTSAIGAGRPTSAVVNRRQRPTSAAVKQRATPRQQEESANMVQQPAQEVAGRDQGLIKADASNAASAKTRPKSAHPGKQQMQQQHNTGQQLQKQQQDSEQLILEQYQQQQPAMHESVIRALQTPVHNIQQHGGMKTAQFPQHELLQAPAHRVPDVITDLVTAANHHAQQHEVAAGQQCAGSPVNAAQETRAASHTSRKHAAVINIGGHSDGSTRHSAEAVATGTNTEIGASNSKQDANEMFQDQQQQQFTVLGTIQEEDSSFQQQHAASGEHQVPPRCLSPVNLAADVSFDSSSYANSGRNSPTSVYHHTRQQRSSNRPSSATAANPRHSQLQQQLQQEQQGEGQGPNGMSAADSSFYGSLASSDSQQKARPWSAAATQAARKLYGTSSVQLAGPAGSQKQQQQRRCESAHPYYSIDTRLMAKGQGKFNFPVSLAASRGAGFRMQQARVYSSTSTRLPSHNSSSSRSAAAAHTPLSAAALRAAAIESLNSSLSASRCGSRQQQQRQQLYSDTGSSESSGPVYLQQQDVQIYEYARQGLTAQQGLSDRYSENGLAAGSSADSAAAAGQQVADGEQQQQQQQQQHAYHEEEADPNQQPQQQQQQQRPSGSRPWSGASTASQRAAGAAAAAAAASEWHEPVAGGAVQYRLPASRPVSAAAVVAAQQRKQQQERLSAAKVAGKLNAPLRSNHSASDRGRSTGNASAAGGGRGQSARQVFSSSRKGNK